LVSSTTAKAEPSPSATYEPAKSKFRLAEPPEAKANLKEETTRIESVLAKRAGNPYAGEVTYAQRCAACHKLFHKGDAVDPNLTSYQRDDLGTLLPSILDPNLEIREGFAYLHISQPIMR